VASAVEGSTAGPARRSRDLGPNLRLISGESTYDLLSEEHPWVRGASALALSETRRMIRAAHSRMMVVFFAILYALGSMVLGGMLILARVPGGYTTEVLWGNALGTGSWNYPGLLIVAPWGVVSLPFLATLAMIIVSIGVGIGVSVAILITVRLVRDRRRTAAGAGSVGSIAGLTPAMIALVTLGACCSTTAAASAGVGIVAQASGSTINNLLINNWYLDVFQIGVMYVALIAQELVLRVYGGLLGLAPGTAAAAAPVSPPRLTPTTVGVVGLRALLLLAGITWSLGMFAEWAGASPPMGSGALWFQWLFQHQLLGDFAVAVALVPSIVGRGIVVRARTSPVVVLRGALLVAGLSLLAWTPPAVAAGGAPGLLNELFGAAGLPASWGAVAPVYSPGIALFARWAFQYVLLGGFGLAAAFAPERVLGRLVAGSPSVPNPDRWAEATSGVPSARAWGRDASSAPPTQVDRGT